MGRFLKRCKMLLAGIIKSFLYQQASTNNKSTNRGSDDRPILENEYNSSEDEYYYSDEENNQIPQEMSQEIPQEMQRQEMSQEMTKNKENEVLSQIKKQKEWKGTQLEILEKKVYEMENKIYQVEEEIDYLKQRLYSTERNLNDAQQFESKWKERIELEGHKNLTNSAYLKLVMSQEIDILRASF